MTWLVAPSSSSEIPHRQPSTEPPPPSLPPSSIKQPPSPPKPPLLSTETESPPDDDEEEEEYGNKSVLLSIANPTNIASWVVIDPTHLVDCELRYSPEFSLPPDLVNNHTGYRPAVCASNMYIIGGKIRQINIQYAKAPKFIPKGPEFLDKMFVYHVKTKTWHETWSFLNVARAFPQVHVIDKLIYVFGGEAAALDPHNWIEYYNPDRKSWKLLPTDVPCYGSEFVSDELPMISDRAYSSVLYKRGRQVLFFTSSSGFHTFNYVDNTWAFVETRIDDFNSFGFGRVAIVEDIMFCPIDATIYVYDLRKKMVVSFHDFKDRLVGQQRTLYLFRVGTKTLLLLGWDVRRIERGERKKGERQDGVNCYRFQIQNESQESCGIRLFQDAHHFFVSQDGATINDFFIIPNVPLRQPSTQPPPPPSLPPSSIQQPPCLPKPPVPLTENESPPSSQPHGQKPTLHQPQLLSTETISIEQPLGHAVSPPSPPLLTRSEFLEYGSMPPPPDLLAAFSVEQHTLPYPPSPQPRPTSDGDEELEEYGNKSNYVSFKFVRIASWTMVYPYNGDCKFVCLHEYDLPQHLEYYCAYVFAVCDSNLYLIGGETRSRYRGFPEFSDRMYMYNVTTKTWNQLSPRLNVARSRHQIVVVDKIIYVFGGHSDVEFGDHNWIEYYDLNDENDKSWKLLSTKLLPDMALDPFSTVHYERGREIIFFCSRTGFYSFNYDDNTWKFIETVINPLNNFCYDRVAIVEDMMFCPLYEIIYVYDLRKKMVVYEHTFEYTNTLRSCQGPLYLFRVGKNKLLLLYSDLRPDEAGEPEPELNCHTYEVQCPSKDSCDTRLIQEAHQIIVSPMSEYIVNFLLI